jgi:hypothetical protein
MVGIIVADHILAMWSSALAARVPWPDQRTVIRRPERLIDSCFKDDS